MGMVGVLIWALVRNIGTRGCWGACFLAALCLSSALAAETGPAFRSSAEEAPTFEQIGGPRSVPNGIVTAIAQDRDGLLWLGSTDGLVRFDGYRFTRWPADRLPSVYVRALLSGRDGSLWVALQSDGVYRRGAGEADFSRPVSASEDMDPLRSGDVLAMAEDLDGAMWFAHAQAGLDRLSPDGQTRETFLLGATLRALRVDAAGDLWIGGRTGLWRKRAGAEDFEVIPAFEGKYVYALYEASNAELWVGTQDDGAAVLDAGRQSVTFLPDATQPDGVGHPWVDGFAERVPGELWIATFGGGVEVRDLANRRLLRRFVHVPGEPGSLAMDRVPTLLRDLAGQLWIPTWGAGLQRLPADIDAVQTLRSRPGVLGSLRHPAVMSSLPMPDGRLWVGSSGAGIDVIDTSTKRVIASFDASDGLADGTIRALALGSDGQLWAGSQQAGLHRFVPAEGRFEGVSTGWTERRVRRLAAASAGGVWVGLELGLVRVGPDGAIAETALGPDGQPVEQPVWSVTEGAEGTLWVGTPNGLFARLPGAEQLTHVAFTAAFGEGGGAARVSGVLDIVSSDSGELWVLAQGGLYRGVSGEAGAPLDFALVLSAGEVPQGLGMQLIRDRDGVLWTGRVRFDPATGQWQSLGPPEGIDVGNPVWPAGSLTPDGQVVVGGTNGLLFIDPSRFKRWDFAPRVVATSIEMDGRAAALNEGRLHLPSGPRRLSVEFAALDFSDPEALRYRYQLEGQDETWIETDATQRVAAYGNLWPGDYTLRVQGSNRVGDWSPYELVLPVTVQAAYWQTRWFGIVAAAGFLGLLVGAVQWRGRRAERQARQLQSLIDERTGALVAARDAAESALVELRDAQSRLVEAEKMASLGQMVAGVAHELNTPLGNALVVSSTLQERADAFATDLTEGRLKRSELEDFLRVLGDGCGLMVRSVERAHDLVSNFKQVAVDRSSSKRRRFDLAVVVSEALVMLGPTLRLKTCRIDCRVPPGLMMDSYPGAISQIVENMVNNALVHAFEARPLGCLVIKAEQISVPQGEAVRLSFIDDGIGMDEATRRRIFEPFFTTRMGRGGTGLGLHIVYNLVVQLLGGRIEVGAVPEGGTRFDLTLPISAPMVDEEPGDALA